MCIIYIYIYTYLYTCVFIYTHTDDLRLLEAVPVVLRQVVDEVNSEEGHDDAERLASTSVSCFHTVGIHRHSCSCISLYISV